MKDSMIDIEIYKKNLSKFFNTSFSTEHEFFNRFKQVSSQGFYTIEKSYHSRHTVDIGPVMDFRISFVSKNAQNNVIDAVETFLLEKSKSVFTDTTWLLLLASIFDDWTHEDQIQNAILKTFNKQQIESVLTKIVDRSNEIDWKGNLVVEDKLDSVKSWRNLFRSFAHFFFSNHFVGVVVYVIKKAREFRITSDLQLPVLLKARLLFELSLDDYLSVFSEDKNIDFICGFLLCGHAFHTPHETIAPDRVSSGLKEYPKLNELIIEIFTDYYYETHLKDENLSKVLIVVAEVAGVELRNGTLDFDLGIKDFQLYPRISALFEKLDSSFQKEVPDHIVKIFTKTISRRIHFVNDVKCTYDFPYDLLSKTNQESYAYILYSILNCSNQVYGDFEKALNRFVMSSIPYYFGRYFSQKLALEVTTNLYLVILSISWLEADLSQYKIRFENIVGVLNRSLLDPYANRLASHIINYERNSSFPDEINSFFSMMDVAKKSNKLNVFDLIAKPIEDKIPLTWPWQEQEMYE